MVSGMFSASLLAKRSRIFVFESREGITMMINTAIRRQEISRRMVLASAAAMAASPASPEDCRIGPPPHDKGPPVWMGLDQVELDAAYDQAFYAPLRLQILKRLASNSELTR